jgi:hypothetical protein
MSTKSTRSVLYRCDEDYERMARILDMSIEETRVFARSQEYAVWMPTFQVTSSKVSQRLREVMGPKFDVLNATNLMHKIEDFLKKRRNGLAIVRPTKENTPMLSRFGPPTIEENTSYVVFSTGDFQYRTAFAIGDFQLFGESINTSRNYQTAIRRSIEGWIDNNECPIHMDVMSETVPKFTCKFCGTNMCRPCANTIIGAAFAQGKPTPCPYCKGPITLKPTVIYSETKPAAVKDYYRVFS